MIRRMTTSEDSDALHHLEVRVSELEVKLADAQEAIDRLIDAINGIVNANDELVVDDEAHAALDRAQVLAGLLL
jgi:uncharacterized coiled-coil protein SlyX